MRKEIVSYVWVYPDEKSVGHISDLKFLLFSDLCEGLKKVHVCKKCGRFDEGKPKCCCNLRETHTS